MTTDTARIQEALGAGHQEPQNRLAMPDAEVSRDQALLREAYARLQEAERHIAAQEEKIRILEELASTDSLTGLSNRRGFEDFVKKELGRIARGTSMGAVLVLIDLDKFKAINDTYSHQAGDACLKAVADMIKKTIRITDEAARLGGDEFAILFAHTDLEKIDGHLGSIRAKLNAVAFDWKSTQLTGAGSMGRTAVTNTDTTFEGIYERADRALYADKAKRQPKPSVK